MHVAHLGQLSQHLLPTVPDDLATTLSTYDWRKAQCVERGKDHTILIADELAVARLPRRRDPDLERKVALVDALDLPWQVPTSLSEVDEGDRKSTRLNSSHVATSYAVFCLKKKNVQ